MSNNRTRTLTVQLNTETDFAGAGAEARREFGGIESAAESMASAIEGSLERAADQAGAAFAGVSADLEADAGRAAEGVGRRFTGIAEDIEREFAGINPNLNLAEAEFDRLRRVVEDIAADDIQLGADGRAVDGEIERVEAKIESAKATVNLLVRGGTARRELREVIGLTEQIDRLDPTIQAEVRARGLDELDRDIERLDRRRVDIEAEVEFDGSQIPLEANRIADQMAPPFEAAATDIQGQLEGIAGNVDLSDVGASITNQLGLIAGVGGPIAAIAATAGALFGDEFSAGAQRAFNSNRGRIELAIQTGFDSRQLASVGQVGGQAYAGGFGEGVGDLRDVAATLEGELRGIDLSLDADEATRQAAVLRDVIGVDIAQSVGLAQRLIANDLVRDTDEAFNLMVGAAQDFGIHAEEVFEVVSEFSPVFAKLGVDGSRAMSIVGEAAQRGLLPNIDRGAELFEEFNVRLAELDTLREPVQALGLDLASLQSDLANGRGAEALTEIVDALLAIEDPARRDALAIEIFGTAIESASDPEAVLQLLATADAIGEVGTAADDAVAELEDAQTALSRLGRRAEQFGNLWARGVNAQLDAADAVLPDVISDFEFLRDRVVGTEVDVAALGDGLNLLDARALSVRDSNNELAESFEGTADGARDVSSAISDLFDFSADQLFRNIADSTDRLAESLGEVDAAAIGYNGTIDISAAGGARLQESLERVAGQQERNLALFSEGSITAAEFSRANAVIEGNLRGVLAAAGLTETQVQGLIDTYLATPDEVNTVVSMTDQASTGIASVQRSVDSLRRPVTIDISTRFTGGPRSVDAIFARRAEGGPTQGLTLVGEEGFEIAERNGRLSIVGAAGPEFIDFGARTMIHDHEDSLRRLGLDRRQSGTPSVGVAMSRASASRSQMAGGPTFQIGQVVTPPGRRVFDELDHLSRMYLTNV